MENLKHKHKDVVVKKIDGELVVTSRQIAEDFEKEHFNVVRDIEGLIKGIIKNEDTPNKMFIESEYQHEQNKQWYKEYLLTRDGFSLLVMGFTGSKALQWKLKYIEAFNKMEQELKGQALNTAKLSKELQAILMLDNKTLELEKKLEKTNNKFDELPLFMSDSKALKKIANRVVVELLGGKQAPAYEPMSKKVFSDLYRQVHREFQISAVEEIKRKDLDLAKEIISGYRLPIALKNEVELLNNQVNLNI